MGYLFFGLVAISIYALRLFVEALWGLCLIIFFCAAFVVAAGADAVKTLQARRAGM